MWANYFPEIFSKIYEELLWDGVCFPEKMSYFAEEDLKLENYFNDLMPRVKEDKQKFQDLMNRKEINIE